MKIAELMDFEIWQENDEPGVFIQIGETIYNFSNLDFISVANKFYVAAQRIVALMNTEAENDELDVTLS